MKNLKKIIKKLVEVSFKDERIVESQVTKSIKILRSLPPSQAIEALSQYLKGLKIRERQHTMYLETVTPLSSTQIQKMKEGFLKKNKITKVVNKINPDILGGFKLRVGDEVWDESIAGKVKQIKEVIING